MASKIFLFWSSTPVISYRAKKSWPIVIQHNGAPYSTSWQLNMRMPFFSKQNTASFASFEIVPIRSGRRMWTVHYFSTDFSGEFRNSLTVELFQASCIRQNGLELHLEVVNSKSKIDSHFNNDKTLLIYYCGNAAYTKIVIKCICLYSNWVEAMFVRMSFARYSMSWIRTYTKWIAF